MTKDTSLFSLEEFKENFVPNKKIKKAEEKIQLAVCNYIRNKYPEVIFTCDLASGLKLPIWLGALHKKMRSSRGLPDLFIARPYHAKRNIEHIMEGPYHGLFLELKKDGTKIRLKNGELTADKHIREQEAILARLRHLGYKSEFAVGVDEAIRLIDEYLS